MASACSQGTNYLEVSELQFSQPLESVLSSAGSRVKCPKCNAQRKYYCYDCVIPLEHEPPRPKHRLPVEFHIIRHASEKTSKSSIIPLKLSYPDDVFLYTFKQPNRFDDTSTVTMEPQLPEKIDWARTALLFPEKDVSKTVAEMDVALWELVDRNERSHCNDDKNASTCINRVIVIDSTWNTAMQVIKLAPGLCNVKHKIKLSSRNQTIFWRHQTIDRSCLATCEAIYVLLREIWDAKRTAVPYDHRYDDVMFYYVFVHSLINQYYKSTKKHKGWLPEYTLTESEKK